MSRYEDYTVKSQAYDETRVPVGLEVIQTVIRGSCATSLVDLGCGTGNYLRAVATDIERGTGLDLNPNMLAKAREKLAGFAHIDVRQGSLTSLPLAAASFDIVVCNQVLHHLDAPSTIPAFTNVRAALAEIFRVLKPGGAVVLNSSSHVQCREGFWWAPLVPQAMERIIARLPDIPQLTAWLTALGFVVDPPHILREPLQGGEYLDPRGPLRETWRRGDSTWSLATADELQAALTRLHALDQGGELEQWFAQRDQLRDNHGQTTSLVARKPAT